MRKMRDHHLAYRSQRAWQESGDRLRHRHRKCKSWFVRRRDGNSSPPRATRTRRASRSLYAEQSPAAWWDGMGEACRAVVAECSDADVVAICLAATSCTVVACGDDGAPLRDCLLWMDQRAAANPTRF